MNTRIFNVMKHSNIICNATTRMTLIDNSLQKDLEIAKNRKLKTNRIKTIENVIEMSESHNTKPCIKNSTKYQLIKLR